VDNDEPLFRVEVTMRKVFAISVAVLSAALLAGAQRTTIRVPYPPGGAELVAFVTFDPSRVSASELKRWWKLANGAYYSVPVAGFYPDCKTSDIPKLEKDIMKDRQIVEELDPNKYPVELAEVVSYLKRVQAFWLWQAEQQLAFLRTGELPAAEYDGTDLKGCTVRHPPNRSDACQLVVFDWHNCVSDAMRKRLGEYPQQQWKAFLDAYGIQERLESTIGD
jgi:hypothetical protein